MATISESIESIIFSRNVWCTHKKGGHTETKKK